MHIYIHYACKLTLKVIEMTVMEATTAVVVFTIQSLGLLKSKAKSTSSGHCWLQWTVVQ